MPRLAPDRFENDDEHWQQWTNVCAEKLEELDEDEFVILHVDEASNVFVQMAHTLQPELLCEVSLGELANAQEAMRSLLDLGWQPPGSYTSGTNLQLVWRSDDDSGLKSGISEEDAFDAAGVIAATLRYVLSVEDPTRIRVERGNV
jgi:hypothetical protein